ncbi:MAG: hypothetical protein KAY24_05020 [Candidatus Eisenbacteria sp.]|nr:hypothetical protein [Candidatus Eisenbacteria bacterium]
MRAINDSRGSRGLGVSQPRRSVTSVPRLGTIHSGLLLCLLAVIAWVGGCSGREHTNPFDPSNPDTGGEPSPARAEARCREVYLSWDTLGLWDLAATRIWRLEEGGGNPPGQLLTTVAAEISASAFCDTSVFNGVLYTYTLEFVFESGSTALVKPVQVRPGPALPWVADACACALSLLSADGLEIRSQVAQGSSILDLDVDAEAHRLFAPRMDRDELLVLRTEDGETIEAWSAPGASCVSWSPAIQTLAVGAFYEQVVMWMSTDGSMLSSVDVGGYVEDVALRDSSTTWVAMYEGHLLRLAFASGERDTMPVDLTRAVAVVDDPDGGGCWVADRAGGIVVYVTDDAATFRSRDGLFTEPLDLDATGTGECWVADRGAQRLILLDRSCSEVDCIEAVGQVAGVTGDPNTGDLWLALPDDSEVRRVVTESIITTKVHLQGCPRKVVGDWLGGCRE